MKRIDLGITGEDVSPQGSTWADLGLQHPWTDVIAVLAPDTQPTEIQTTALGNLKLLSSRRNLIISSPTNSGKSLLGYLGLIEAVLVGRRALLLEPLRALAQEKYDELSRTLPKISAIIGRSVDLSITTGDYRVENEMMHSPPPEGGQIVIATPERIEAILRNPEFDRWLGTFGAVVVDEAQLLSSAKRGPSLEFVLTNFLITQPPPRLFLLSATIGDVSDALHWLAPCDLGLSSVRRPPLTRSIVQLDPGENADETVFHLAQEILASEDHSLLIFTYQTASTHRLARALSERLGSMAGILGVRPYHTRMPRNAREKTRAAYVAGETRAVVSTTALAAGVNLPATHVIIRDLTFHGSGPISLDQIVQMCGRAGRGSRIGHAFLIQRPGDAWSAEDLSDQLRSPMMPSFSSALAQKEFERGRGNAKRAEDHMEATSTFLLGLLLRSREKGISLDEIRQFVGRSLAGPRLSASVEEALAWLSNSSRVFVYETDEGLIAPTSLGIAAGRSSLPLRIASGIAQLVRDLLALGSETMTLECWGPMDHLVVLELLAERSWALRLFSEDLQAKVDTWMEKSSQKSSVYREWIRGGPGHSKAQELLGSMGVLPDKRQKDSAEWCRRRAYVASFNAIVLWERSNGEPSESLARKWLVEDFAGFEEQWRDNRLWLLAGLAQIFEIKCFYFHLRTECNVTGDEIHKVKRKLQRIRMIALQTSAHVKQCSPLAPLVADMRKAGGKPGIGEKTLEKLENLATRNIVELSKMSVDDLRREGISCKVASRIQSYLRRRMR